MLGCCCCTSVCGFLLTTGAVILIGLLFSKKDPPKVAGVYTQKGKSYWFKVLIFYFLVKFRKWKDARSRDKNSDAGYGGKSKTSPEEMERVQELVPHFEAIDAVYFNGAGDNGFSIVSGMARRPNGVINGFFIFRIPELGYLLSPKFPDSFLFGGNDQFYGAEGFKFEPVVPMKHWKLEYNGDLKLLDDPSKKVNVSFKADWKSGLDYFDFDTNMPTWTLARCIALESWSKEYFQNLKDTHQTHYEQHGDLTGEIVVDGKKYDFKMPSMRDHSYGKRNWKLLHRYNMHMFCLEDGRRFNIGNICHPCVTSSLELGYMYDHDGTLYPLEMVDHPLQHHGELGDPPTDYGVTIKATNGHSYYVQVTVLDTHILNIGWEWEARIVERRCKFVVDGIEGFGISECMYRHVGGRPEEYSNTDPKDVNK